MKASSEIAAPKRATPTGADRNTPAHYDAPIRNPAPSSVFAFYVAGLAILDAEPRLAPWLGPVDLDASMDPIVRDYFTRTNLDAIAFEQAIAGPFEAKLQEAVPKADLGAGPVRELVDMFTASQRALLAATFGGGADEHRSTDEVGYRQELGVRAIYATRLMLGFAGQKATYTHLNDGGRGGGLTRHHVDSATKTMLRWVNGENQSRRDLILRRALADEQAVLALAYLRQQALSDRRFSHLKGAELAHAIHDHRDLNESVFRARKRMDGQQRAARKSRA
jgi:hypothetical protein